MLIYLISIVLILLRMLICRGLRGLRGLFNQNRATCQVKISVMCVKKKPLGVMCLTDESPLNALKILI